ncbi:hypothetical protein BDV95DRAFT_608490 [Massariosphaeria phaeospora]|uniref:FAD/NAD(P)-binding domain-containing protein n=1 Tax=Massariosphaeria phaeospora TaxID=100035 RepID=A0A7C8I6V8_9PLEO|nr:hypothetical protein BDV95DRAFT_608490 [Massariosphaeria phaeospora]
MHSNNWSLVLPLLAILSLTASASPTRRSQPPVCVIGGGPSGLTAASRLEAKGIPAVIFEKQPEIGGKCQSYYDEQGIFHPLGAAFFSNASYSETVKVVDVAGVAIEEFALAGARQMFRFNYTEGEILDVLPLDPGFLVQIAQEIARYAGLWRKMFVPISVPSFKKGVPADLTVSGAEWFRKNNFTVLPLLLVNPLALYGYGDIREVPALYVLQYITPDILTAFIGQHNVYYTDFNKVWVEWAKKTLRKTPINLEHDIHRIDRSGRNPVLTYTKPNGNFSRSHSNSPRLWGHQECSSLVLAFPPTLDNLQNVGLDLTQAEHNVFSKVGVHNYYSSAYKFDMPFGVSYISSSPSPFAPPPSDGQPVAVLRLNAKSDISTAWSWGPYRAFQSEAYARDLLQSTMSALNKDPRNATAPSRPLHDDDIRAFRKWDYFPHFDSEPLRNGVYDEFNALQGEGKAYWASGLNGMETVEWTIRGAAEVVDTHFGNLTAKVC